LSIAFLLDEKPNVASVGSGGQRSDAREVFVMAPLLELRAKRRHWLALASDFRLLRLSGALLVVLGTIAISLARA
jgi:hypothetical protein